jgi:exodeoxyribonuclease VII large subunit
MAVPDLGALRTTLAGHRAELSERARARLENAGLRLFGAPERMLDALNRRLENAAWTIAGLWKELESDMEAVISRGESRACALKAGLDALGPASVLGRGYAMLLNAAGAPVSSVSGAAKGDFMTAVLRDGRLEVEVKAKEIGRSV